MAISKWPRPQRDFKLTSNVINPTKVRRQDSFGQHYILFDMALGLIIQKAGLQSPQQGLVYIIILYVAFIACKTLVRIFASPLRRVPGPFWARVTSFPISTATVKGRRAQELYKLHKQYGSVVRIGPNEVSIGDHRYYRPIYTGSNSIVKDPRFYAGATFVGHDNIFQMTNPNQHSARRRLSAVPYSLQSVASFNPLVRKKAKDLAAKMLLGAKASPTRTIDAFDLCSRFSLEVICQAAFAMDLSAAKAKDDKIRLLMKAMDDSAKTLPITSIMPWLGTTKLGRKIHGPIGLAFRQLVVWQTLSREMVDHLIRVTASGAESTEKNLLAPLLNGVDSFLDRRLTKDELLEEAMGIMFAGSGTTSTTLTYLLYAISCPENAAVQSKLRDEVLSLPENDTLALRSSLYINAVIKETFRLYPTIISTLPRIVTQPFHLENITLPAGTVVGMQNYVHHRDPTIFPRPHDFRPERWLESTKEMDLSLTPFSIGRRNCIGQNLAWEELYLAVDAVMRGGFTLLMSNEMESSDMEMEDRFNIAPKGRRLLLEVIPYS
ncbi:cytochrome P450 [Aspergillus pseudoustus]|uniref:Cytochrome P450 n=1 Tax=Aspergillus pseudoustus TaxID=1810923 RepID=A0ABR4INF0_9EURO